MEYSGHACNSQLSIFRIRKLLQPRQVSSSFKLRRKKDIHHLARESGLRHAASEAHHLRVIVFPRHLGIPNTHTPAAADAMYFVCNHRFTIAAPAEDDAGAPVLHHRLRRLSHDRRIVDV